MPNLGAHSSFFAADLAAACTTATTTHAISTGKDSLPETVARGRL
jgi:hypothetical protein